MEKFRLIKLSDVVRRVKVGFVGSINEFYCERDLGVPLIRTTDIDDLGINYSNLKYVTKQFHIRNRKSQVKNGDLIIARHGENGKANVFNENFEAQVLNAVIIEPDQSKVTSRLLKLFFDSPFVKRQISGVVKGSVQGVINTSHIADILLPIHDEIDYLKLDEIIANVDSKISLNNRINGELEAMAKTIYDYWFVQFDFPISKEQARAMGKPKLEGKPYKASGGKMVWSVELKREVPGGWEVKRMSDLIASDKNGDWGEEEQGGNYSLKVNCIRGTDINGLNGLEQCDPPLRYILPKNSHKILNSHDLIVEISGGSPTQSTGRLAFITDETLTRFDNPLICSNFCKAISLKDKKYIYNFVCYWNLLYRNGAFFGYEGKTSGIKNLLFESFVDSHWAVVPGETIVESFYKLMSGFQAKKQAALKENQKLSELRDWLLPMLMNGQVRLKETAQSKVAKPVLPENNPSNSYFYQTQLVAAIVNASKKHKISHGEMTLAKYTYLVDKLYGVPTYFNYERLHLGPYPKEMKKIVNNKKFFKIQNNEVSVVPQKKEYRYQFQQQVDDAIAELASLFNQYKGRERSYRTELFATVCKVVEDMKSTDLKEVRESMKNWPIDLKSSKFRNKAEKFNEKETATVLKLLGKQNWMNALLGN